MSNSFFRDGLILAVSFCSVLFTSCGITPLLYPPVDDKSPAAMFDADLCGSLLKTGRFRSEDGTVKIAFSACDDDLILTNSSTMKDGFEKYVVRGYVTIIDDGNKDKAEKTETWLPVLLVPFRSGDTPFFYLVLDQMYLVEKYKLNPEYIFMMRPYSYILSAERKDGGWEIGFVQFATNGIEIKKVAENVQVDKDGTVLNPPAEVLEMLKDPKNYEISSKTVFLPEKKEN